MMAVGIVVGSPLEWPLSGLLSGQGLLSLAFAVLVLALGWVYGRCVPASIELVDGEMLLATVGLVGGVRERLDAPLVAASHWLSSNAGGLYTPDMTLLRLQGRWLPLLIDSRATVDRTHRLPAAREVEST